MAAQTVLLEGKPYVFLPRDEYDRLTALAKAGELPPLPPPDAQGNYPAVQYARASLAQEDNPRSCGRRIKSARIGLAGGRPRGDDLPH